MTVALRAGVTADTHFRPDSIHNGVQNANVALDVPLNFSQSHTPPPRVSGAA